VRIFNFNFYSLYCTFAGGTWQPLNNKLEVSKLVDVPSSVVDWRNGCWTNLVGRSWHAWLARLLAKFPHGVDWGLAMRYLFSVLQQHRRRWCAHQIGHVPTLGPRYTTLGLRFGGTVRAPRRCGRYWRWSAQTERLVLLVCRRCWSTSPDARSTHQPASVATTPHHTTRPSSVVTR